MFPRGHLAMSGDILAVTSRERGWYGHPVGSKQGAAQDDPPHRDIPARWPWSEGGKPCFVRVLPLSLYRAMGCPLKSHQPLSQQVAGTTGWGWGLVIEYLSHSDPQGLGWGQNWHFCRFQDGDRWAFSPPSAPCSVLYLRCDLSHLGSCLLHWTLSRLHLLPTLSL